MTAELVLCVTCGEAFESVDLFEGHMVANHGPGSARDTNYAPRVRMLDLPDDDDDDDDEEENGELFPHKPELVSRRIETYRRHVNRPHASPRAEQAIEDKSHVELAELLDLVEQLDAELFRLAIATIRRRIEFVLRDDRTVTR